MRHYALVSIVRLRPLTKGITASAATRSPFPHLQLHLHCQSQPAKTRSGPVQACAVVRMPTVIVVTGNARAKQTNNVEVLARCSPIRTVVLNLLDVIDLDTAFTTTMNARTRAMAFSVIPLIVVHARHPNEIHSRSSSSKSFHGAKRR